MSSPGIGFGLTSGCGTGGDNGQTLAAFCAATTCFKANWIDQSGNGNDEPQATPAAQAQIILTGGPSGANAYSLFVPTNVYQTAGNVSLVAPRTYSAVAYQDSGNGGAIIDHNSNPLLFFSSNNILLGDANLSGFVTATQTTATWHSFQAISNGASSSIYVDGTATTGNSGPVGTTSYPFTVGAQANAGGSIFSGRMTEVIVYPTAMTPTEAANMNANQHGASGFNF